MLDHIKHFFQAAGYSLQGLRATLKNEMAFQQEFLVLLIMIPLVFCLDVSGLERALMLGSWLLVMVVELLNAAIESVVDRIGLEKHALSGRAKDQASAAVLVAIVMAILIWLGVLL